MTVDTMVKASQPFRGVIHLAYPNQTTLCKAFMRVQEFYESPIGDFRGRYFTRQEFKEAYAAENGTGTGYGEFTYYDEWGGFNVPGDVFDEFIRQFDIDFMEENMVALVQENRTKGEPYYVIGTFVSDTDPTLEHELSHAMWYLHEPYRRAARKILEGMSERFLKRCRIALESNGYHADMVEDEVVAYLSTSRMPEIVDIMECRRVPWSDVLKLQENFEKYLKGLTNG